MQKRKAQFEFGWLFALIIGAMILFMAVFFAGKIFKTGTYLTETEILRNFDIILNPFSSVGSIASLTLSKPVEMPYQTELKINCDPGINQGQEIMLRQFEKGKAGEWTSYTIRNKYIFAPSNLSGKTFWVFSKPLELPWRVDDLIYMISEDYCFIGAPQNIEEELNRINASKIHLYDCTANMKEVCFGASSCDIKVNYASHTAYKAGEPVPNYYFADDATMYAAIFSSKQIYDCNMQRILSRMKIQAEIYSEWASSLTGCVNPMLPATLSAFSNDIDDAISNPSRILDLASRAGQAENLDSYDCPIIKK